MTGDELSERAGTIQAQLRRVYRLKGRDLAQATARGRRLLPRGVRHDLDQISDALDKLGHPKLERTLDFAGLKRASDRVSAHLGGVDLKDRRRGALLSLAGAMAFNVIAVATLFIVWMVWAGQI